MIQATEKNSYSSFIATFLLIIILGYPRVYGTEVPMAILVAPFFVKGFFTCILAQGRLAFGFILLFFTWLIWGWVCFIGGSGESGDVFFHLVLSVKIFLNFFFGYVIYKVISSKPNALLYWLFIQSIIIVLSITSFPVYSFLLGFISSRSADVFQHIFGLRALGLGLYHVDGAMMLLIAVFYYVLLTKSSFFKNLFLICMLPLSMAVARSGIISYVALAVLKRGFIFKFLLAFSAVLMVILSVYSTGGVLYEMTELFRNLLNRGSVESHSVNAVIKMYTLPDSVSVYLFGEGKYFSMEQSSLAFYMGTDVGYMRILYFSGIFSIVIFILLNTYNLISLLFGRFYPEQKDIKRFSLALIGIFLILNFKGLQIMPLFSVTLYLYAHSCRKTFYLQKRNFIIKQNNKALPL